LGNLGRCSWLGERSGRKQDERLSVHFRCAKAGSVDIKCKRCDFMNKQVNNGESAKKVCKMHLEMCKDVQYAHFVRKRGRTEVIFCIHHAPYVTRPSAVFLHTLFTGGLKSATAFEIHWPLLARAPAQPGSLTLHGAWQRRSAK
jgi:hypothetical protein